MLSRIITLIIIILQVSLTRSSSIIPPFNLSHFIYPKVTTFTESNTPPPRPQDFLQGVLDAIAKKEKWSLEDIRVSDLDVKKAKYRSVQTYEFRVRAGRTEIVLKMHDEVSEWNKLVALGKNGSLDFEALARNVASKAVIDSFKIEGPFELQVDRDDDQLSLMLPVNTSYSGLRRISVGQGITVEVKGAEKISIFHPSNHQHHHQPQPPHGVSPYMMWIKNASFCTALFPIRIVGSASVVAYRNTRPTASIQTVFRSRNAIKLLPEKCYIHQNYEQSRNLFSFFSDRIALLGQVLRRFLNERENHSAALSSLKSTIRASIIFGFQLGLEKDIGVNDTYWSTLADWRTRPIVERVLFQVVARIDGEVMKPIIVKKVRPFIDTDSFAWSSLLSNLSFTNFPSVVPPEALTLDVKW